MEVALEKEVDTIRTQQGKMRDFLLQVFTIFQWNGVLILLQVNKQLGGCQSNQGRLEQDLENKDVALDIDHTCHNIHNNSKDIQLHGGIERQVKKNPKKTQSRKHKIQS